MRGFSLKLLENGSLLFDFQARVVALSFPSILLVLVRDHCCRTAVLSSSYLQRRSWNITPCLAGSLIIHKPVCYPPKKRKLIMLQRINIRIGMSR